MWREEIAIWLCRVGITVLLAALVVVETLKRLGRILDDY